MQAAAVQILVIIYLGVTQFSKNKKRVRCQIRKPHPICTHPLSESHRSFGAVGHQESYSAWTAAESNEEGDMMRQQGVVE